jgi:hypothetical protein
MTTIRNGGECGCCRSFFKKKQSAAQPLLLPAKQFEPLPLPLKPDAPVSGQGKSAEQIAVLTIYGHLKIMKKKTNRQKLKKIF